VRFNALRTIRRDVLSLSKGRIHSSLRQMVAAAPTDFGHTRMNSRQPLRNPPARIGFQSPKGDFAMVGAVSTAGLILISLELSVHCWKVYHPVSRLQNDRIRCTMCLIHRDSPPWSRCGGSALHSRPPFLPAPTCHTLPRRTQRSHAVEPPAFLLVKWGCDRHLLESA